MLASVAHRYGFEPPKNDQGKHYGKGYSNHPCSVWAGDTRTNYLFVCDYCQALILEANNRGYASKYQDKLNHCRSKAHLVPEGKLTSVPLAMARTHPLKKNERDPNFYYDCCRSDNLVCDSSYNAAVHNRKVPLTDAVKFYRGYLLYGKCHYAAWRHTPVPYFWHTQDNHGKLFCKLKKSYFKQ